MDPSTPSQASHFPTLPPLVEVPLVEWDAHPCPYLAGQVSVSRAFLAQRMPGEVYHAFMDAGFRRSGRVIYQNACPHCRACVPLRVPVARFAPGKSQRRCWRRNQDLVVRIAEPHANGEKFDLYARYCADWHGRPEHDRDAFEAFLYESPVDTLEFEYRTSSGRLIGVGICDVCRASLSSVYFYFDPAEARRGLGTFGVLREIEFARDRGIPYYYFGYWVQRCPSMSYKADFRPFEVLQSDGTWRESGKI